MSKDDQEYSKPGTRALQWAEGLGQVFSHVALFEICGTVARVAEVFGFSSSVVGRSLSLTAKTPLRWSLEAASALVSSGSAPGGAILSKGLGLDRPKAYAVLPLVVQGKLVALAYVDNGLDALSMSAVSKVFGIVDASLRDDISYVTHLLESHDDELLGPVILSQEVVPETDNVVPVLPGEQVLEAKVSSSHFDPGELDEIEAMIDKALASNPLVSELSNSREVQQIPPPGIGDLRGSKEPPISSFELQEWIEPDRAAKEGNAVSTEAANLIRKLAPKNLKRRFPLRVPQSFEDKKEARRRKLREVLTLSGTHEESANDSLLYPGEWDEARAQDGHDFALGEAPPAPCLEQAPAQVLSFDKAVDLQSTRPRENTPLVPEIPKKFMIAASLLVLMGAAVMGLMSPPGGGPPAGFTFRIHPNSSVKQIANHLERQGVIRSSFLFVALAKTRGVERGLRAGGYSIPRGAWAWDVLSELNQGQIRTRDVTIPEGLTLQETAEIIEANGLVSARKFLKAARDKDLIEAFGIQAPTLEGYLFPETYTFAEEISAKDIVKEMVDLFFARLTQVTDQRELGPTELMEHVILASIIEREAKDPTEMPRIAGVFRNRLSRNMRLESCATIQYILGKPKERLLLSDLRKESPYNTYLKPGLPPGPIASPGLKALQASLQPEAHSYLFFLAKNDGSNAHVFTQTYAQHQEARLRQKQMGRP